MAILLMLGWWYSRGWIWVIKMTENRLKTVSRVFAVGILLKTLFAPWKQIYRESTFSNFLPNLVDNTVSRCIGAVVRGGMLLAAGMVSLAILLLGVVSAVVWPLIPLLAIILPALSLAGVSL